MAESKMTEFKMAEFKMATIIKFISLNYIEFRVRVEWEWFWVNLREDNKVSESKMAGAESKMPEFKMAAIIKLRQNEGVKFSVQMVGREVWEKFFLFKWWEPILASVGEFQRKN